jgi:hypothetical protein
MPVLRITGFARRLRQARQSMPLSTVRLDARVICYRMSQGTTSAVSAGVSKSCLPHCR